MAWKVVHGEIHVQLAPHTLHCADLHPTGKEDTIYDV